MTVTLIVDDAKHVRVRVSRNRSQDDVTEVTQELRESSSPRSRHPACTLHWLRNLPNRHVIKQVSLKHIHPFKNIVKILRLPHLLDESTFSRASRITVSFRLHQAI